MTLMKFDADCTDLQGKTVEELKAELARVLSITAESLLRAAAIVRMLETRGVDLSELRIGLLGYLRKIACGQVLPDVVARFVGHPSLLKAVASLPTQDQRRCLEAESLPIGMLVNGEVDQRMKALTSMEPFEVKQVFAESHIREPSEQVAWLRSRELRRPQLERPVEPPPYTIANRCVVVNRPTRLSVKDLRNLIRAIDGSDV